MLSQFVMLAALISIPAYAFEGGQDWLNQSPKAELQGSGTVLPSTDIYEVAASREYVAVLRDLSKLAFVEIDENLAKWFTGHYFKRKPGERTYLVRAVNTNGGTGSYRVSRFGNSLLVSHGSLGRANSVERSALIINVDFQVDLVHLSAGGAL